MLLTVPDLLTAQQLDACRQELRAAQWTDGRATAGPQALMAKRNLQLPDASPVAQRIGALVLDALSRNLLFMSAALPLKVLPPRFNRYEGGGQYGNHIDAAVMTLPDGGPRVRTDIAATLFFSEPHEYEGGELVIESTGGATRVKGVAGSMVLYPATSLHRVTAVTSGARLASFFWVQSLVRDLAHRRVLFALDRSIQRLSASQADAVAVGELTAVYQNLLRLWSDT